MLAFCCSDRVNNYFCWTIFFCAGEDESLESVRAFAATGIETSSGVAWTNRELVNWFQNQCALPASA